MVFSSIPAYLDPSNWQQQPNPQAGGSSNNGNAQFPLPYGPRSGSGTGSIRPGPGSMSDRARMANIPMPEAALKCPRCESTNTKFCYFNNYNLTQPRYFCKTCRRYWTRGGALRNVPVGGGSRRNKRSKRSKSPVSTSDQQTCSTDSSTKSTMLGLPPPQIPPQPSFLSTLSQLTDQFDVGDIGLNFNGISAPLVATSGMNFPLGNISLCGGCGGGGYMPVVDQSLLQLQPPAMTTLGFELPAGLYPFQGGLEPSGYMTGGVNNVVSDDQPKSLPCASMKMEESSKELNLSRPWLGIQGNDNQYWSTAAGSSSSTVAWTDLSGFRSAATSTNLNP